MSLDSSYLDSVLYQGKDMVEFYINNPCIAAYDLLKVDLAPIQRVIFEDMWFKNYVITIAGRGAGKGFLLGLLSTLSCLLYPGYRVGLIAPVFRQSLVISDSYITSWTSSGLKSTAECLYESVIPNITQTQSLYNQNTVLSKWKNDERACISIKTTKGFEISGSIDHSVLVLDNNFNLIYKELQDIKNEYIVIKRGFNYFGNNNSLPDFEEFKHDWRTKDCAIPKNLTTDLAYWMGLLVGDGCVSVSADERKQRIDFVNEDLDLLDSFENYLRKYFLIDKNENISRDNRKNNTWEIQYFCKKLVQYLIKCGFTKTTALDKSVPDVIKKASRDILIAFLQGLFDTDGSVYIQQHNTGTHCEICFNTSSKQLALEVQSILLNLGIVSNFCISNKACVKKLPQGNRPSKCSEGYKIRITGQEYLSLFNDVVGFRSIRKQELLLNYTDNHFYRKESTGRWLGLPQSLVNSNYVKSAEYVDNKIYFVKPISKDYFFAPTMDIEVENECCYWANGFINHNSKLIFAEVEKLYSRSSILREACEKKPTRGSDTCYLKFKSVGGLNGSYIEALPLGTDGSKIRGSRFYLIVVDELAQVPDKILDLVVRPMAATTLEPMENVRKIEHQKKLIEAGLATEDDFQDETVNKMVMASSGYYKFNHMWRRMKDYWSQMDKYGDAKSPYVVHQIPYWDLPEGFLDKKNIEEAKRVMSNSEFRMEYEAAMVSDSEGFFKASLLEACTIDSGFYMELKGAPGEQYILGVDPNQGGNASCGVIVVKLGRINKIVNVLELKGKTTQETTRAVQGLCDAYNVVHVFMDRGGGGKAVCDLLEEGYDGREPIIDTTNKDNEGKAGRHILEMVNFNPAWISDANFTTKALLENKTLRFPEPPISTLELDSLVYEKLNILKSQMLNIVVSQTPSGLLHFDTPKKGQNKDLYSAVILAAHGVRIFEKMNTDVTYIQVCSNGLVRTHSPGATFASQTGKHSSSSLSPMQAALLKPRKKKI